MRRLIGVAVLLLLLGVVWWAWTSSASSPLQGPTMDRAATDSESPPRGSSATEVGGGAPSGSDRTRVESVPMPGPAAEAEAAPEAPFVVDGRVLDLTGAPLAGVALSLRGAALPFAVESGTDGRFEFDAGPAAVNLLLAGQLELEIAPGQRWASALDTPFSRERHGGLLVVAAPAIELGGTVEDEQGVAIEGASVSLRIESTDLRKFPAPLDRNAPRTLATRSGPRGAFSLQGVPAVQGSDLQASRGERARGTLVLEGETALDLRLVLHDGVQEAAVFAGVVLDMAGAPVEDARVSLAESTTETDDRGRFELPAPDRLSDGAPLVAVKRGLQAAVDRSLAERLERRDFSPLLLRLGPATLEIRGKVLLADGAPAKGWTVSLADGTELSSGSVPPTIAEGLAAGNTRGSPSVTTDRSGEFTLRGLSARDYTLRAWQPKSLLVVRAERVAAGRTDVVLRLGPDAVATEVRGRVVDRRGQAVPEAQVSVELVTFASGGASAWESSKAVATGADGTFQLKNVPRAEVRIAVHGDALMEQRWEVAEVDLAQELRLQVDLRAHFRVLREKSPLPATRGEVLDEHGATLQVFSFQNGGWSSSSSIPLSKDGASHSLGVSERGSSLVLYAQSEEVARLPLVLLPGQVLEVRY